MHILYIYGKWNYARVGKVAEVFAGEWRGKGVFDAFSGDAACVKCFDI